MKSLPDIKNEDNGLDALTLLLSSKIRDCKDLLDEILSGYTARTSTSLFTGIVVFRRRLASKLTKQQTQWSNDFDPLAGHYDSTLLSNNNPEHFSYIFNNLSGIGSILLVLIRNSYCIMNYI